jgi:hypothetical protein
MRRDLGAPLPASGDQQLIEAWAILVDEALQPRHHCGFTISEMKLYVCWGTFRPERHPCGNAYKALADAGHQPEIVKTHGCYGTDPLFPGRREVKRLTGNYKVPTLVLDDGTVVDDSANIIGWAKSNPA